MRTAKRKMRNVKKAQGEEKGNRLVKGRVDLELGSETHRLRLLEEEVRSVR